MRIADWNEDSILSRVGYSADGTQSNKVRILCINKAIDGRMEKALEVLMHLRWLADDRGRRCVRAESIWKEDMEYVCGIINHGLKGDPADVEFNVMKMRYQQAVRRRRAAEGV